MPAFLNAADPIDTLTHAWAPEPWMQTGLALLLLLTFAWLTNWIAKRIVLRIVMRVLDRGDLLVG